MLLTNGRIFVIAAGSDFPVEDPNPFHGIYAAVTRRPLSGEERGWQPEQRMTREEAVRAFTTWAAYAARREAELGSLEPGKRADLVVCSEDVFTCPEARIKDIAPEDPPPGCPVVAPAGYRRQRRVAPPRGWALGALVDAHRGRRAADRGDPRRRERRRPRRPGPPRRADAHSRALE